MNAVAIEAANVSHRYGSRLAVDDLSLSIKEGEIFAFLGPNGSGKTTLFRVLSTLIPLQSGQITILGYDLQRQCDAIRRSSGIVFQAASLDKKLTVAENLRHQGRLYGLRGEELRSRINAALLAVAMTDWEEELVEKLSGGMRRRVEIAKGMLHRPRLLLMDEPSTGLDPGARSDLWRHLDRLRADAGVTIVLTTHLLEEADRADRLAIMHRGRLAALDTPAALQASVGGDAITMQSDNPAELAGEINSRFRCQAMVVGRAVRMEQTDGHRWISKLMEAFPDEIQSITLGKPTLEDVFIDRTGHRFFGDDEPDGEAR